MFEKNGGVALRQSISGHLCLIEAYLSYLNFGDEGTIALANSLREGAPSLRILEVERYDITPRETPALAKCLAVKCLGALEK
ncbi:hypothetical protein SUGI_0803010 [Cryptomeria japonica]|nr:hypothetical protein SUGI_0803010 [Cryptomeria japonica]